MKINFKFLSLLILFFSENIIAQLNCKGLDESYNQNVKGIKKTCEKKSQCDSDVLDWTGCGYPIAHNDQEKAKQLLEMRSELHQKCKYIRPPCPSIPSEAFCVSSQCMGKEEVIKNNYKLKIKFLMNKVPIAKGIIVLDYDNGIRCEAAPCPSRTVLTTHETQADGVVELSLNDLINPRQDTNVPTLRHDDVNLERLRFNYQDKYFSNFDLYQTLAKKTDPMTIEINWTNQEALEPIKDENIQCVRAPCP